MWYYFYRNVYQGGMAVAVREHVLRMLESARGQYFSGEALAAALGVSRTAVWKAVQALRADGYPIDAVQNRGYALAGESDVMTAESIRRYLKTDLPQIAVYKTLPSTNDLARRLAATGAPEGTAVVARSQTGGRGRKGRSFFSPPDSGVYISLVLRPALPAEKTLYITTAAAAAVALAVEEVAGCPAAIKWINDIYVRGKKVCGILTEGVFAAETGALDYAVLGIGINVTEPPGGFPAPLREKAGAVFDAAPGDASPRLAAAVIDRFFGYYADLAQKPFLADYRRRMFLTGQKVTVVSGDTAYPAVAGTVDDELALTVTDESGRTHRLQSGEVTIVPG